MSAAMSETPGADTLELTPGERLIEGAREALAIARGEIPAARITINGHAYVPETELASLRAEKEEQAKWLHKLQGALAFWMPSVTEKIEEELNGRAGDDAYLLAGYEGDFPAECWGDLTVARAEAAESLLAEAGKALEPFAAYLAAAAFDLDDKGNPLPDEQGMGWTYLTVGDFRRARSVSTKIALASNAEVAAAAVSADAIAVLLSENTDIEDSSYVAVQIASLIEAGLAATLDQQVKHMVERFLRWRLPENFNPDCGISFKATYNENSPFGPSKAEPVGTNLFDYTQAEAMVRHMLDGLPVQAARAPQAPQGDGVEAVKVKPLEWEVDHVGGGLRAGEYRIRAGVWTRGYYWRRGEDDPHTGYPDEEDAKAAAQLDWDAYIRSALSGAAPQAGEDGQ